VGHRAPGGWVRDAHKRLFFVALGQRQVVATRAVDGTYFALRVAELAGLKKDNLDWQGHRVMVYGKGAARHDAALRPSRQKDHTNIVKRI